MPSQETENVERNAGRERSAGRRLAEYSIRYPVTISMIFVSFLVLGAISIWKIPLVMLPDINFPFVMVHVPYPNTTPAQIQETITRPLEEALSTLPNIQRLTSRSSQNSAFITLHFGWGQDMDLIRSQIREKVEQVRNELPEDVEHIYVRNRGTDDFPILFGQIASGRDMRESYDFLNLKIIRPLEQIPGVAEVEIHGAARKEIGIYLRLDDVKRYRVDVGRLFRRLQAANLDVSLGHVTDGGIRYGILARGAMGSIEEFRKFPVNERGILLADVGDVDFRNPTINSGRHLNGAYAMSLEIRKASEANTVATVRRVMEKIEEFQQDPTLQGVEVLIWRNAAEEITQSLSGLLKTGIVGGILAVLVLLAFLRRLGPTLAVGMAIPFSLVATVGFLHLLGKTLNVLSMMGLMLAIGMLVDNAVVVLESIYQQIEKGKDRVTAARVGPQQVLNAVSAATLTSVIIFVPLVFGQDTNLSIWLSHTGIAIIIALFCSLFISLTLIPMGMARLIRVDVTRRPRWERWVAEKMSRSALSATKLIGRRMGATAQPGGGVEAERPFSQNAATEFYLRLSGWPLRHRFLVGFLLAPAIVAGSLVLLLKEVPDNSPEARDLQELRIQYDFSENYHYAKIERDYVGPVEKFLLDGTDRFKIKDVYSRYGNNNASTQIFFDKKQVTLEELTDLRQQIIKGLPKIPGVKINLGWEGSSQNPNSIGVHLYGPENAVIQKLVREAKKRLKARPEVMEVHSRGDSISEEVQVRLNHALAKKYNISPESVGRTLGIVVRGQPLRGFPTTQGEVDVWMRLRPGDREDLTDLKSVVVGRGSEGTEVLLSQVADFRIVKMPGMIEREDRRTNASLFVVYTGDKKDEGQKLIGEVMKRIDYPLGYGWSFSFWTKRQQQEDRDFLFNLLLALFMVYFVMASLFESLAHPFAIMFSLPFALAGVAWTLYLTGTPFNLMAMIGIMVLLGIVVNNGIVLVDHINNLRRQGVPRAEAVREGCRERFRPILMTAGTTVVGLIPLAMGTSGMFDLRYFPLARTVMGGLIASTVLTLVVLPTYYTLFDDLSAWLKRTWSAGSPS